MSYLEFHTTGKKLARYNTTIVALEGVLVWWYSISSVDKASITNIHDLVMRSESILSAERGTWLSTAAKAKETEKKKENQQHDQKKDR